MRKFAWPDLHRSALKAIIAIVAVTVAVLLGIDRVDLLQQIHELKAINTELTTQNVGPQGPDGDPGRAPTGAEILQAVTDYCSASNLCVGPTGDRGATGDAGAAGASVGSVKCNGTSIAFYSTTGTNLGSVKAVCIP